MGAQKIYQDRKVFTPRMSIIKDAIREYFYPITATINWFKKLNYIVKHYDEDKIVMLDRIRSADLRIRDGVQIIKDRTTINADISPSMRDPSQIITIGRYNGRDYVQVFSIHDDDFRGLIQHLREMERYGTVSKIDAPYGFEYVIEQDFGHL